MMKGTASVLAAAMVASAAGPAVAGGMVLHTRGVRPSARGGAFVAGADDLGAFWFNPAGLAHLADDDADHGKKQYFLFDAAWVSQSVTYTRIDSGMNALAPIKSSAPGLAVPSIAYGRTISNRLVVGGGLWAPYAG